MSKHPISSPLTAWASLIFRTTGIISIVVVALYFASRYVGGLLGIEIADSSAIFLSLVPFVIYLVVSGRITELKGGSFEVKFREAVGEKVLFEQQPVEYEESPVETKGGYDVLNRMIVQAAEGHPTTLGLIANVGYSPSMLREYLERLSRFERAEYVVFSDRSRKLRGFVPLRSLLESLTSADGDKIIDMIAEGNLDSIPGFRRDFMRDAVSNKEALHILENRRVTDIAVTDVSGEFRGFTNKNTIMLSIVKSLLTKV